MSLSDNRKKQSQRSGLKEPKGSKKLSPEEVERKKRQEKRNLAIIRLVYKDLRARRADHAAEDDWQEKRLSIKLLFADVANAVRYALAALKHQEARAGVSFDEFSQDDCSKLTGTFVNQTKWFEITQEIDEKGFALSLSNVGKHCGLLEEDIRLGSGYLYQRLLDQAKPEERLKSVGGDYANEIVHDAVNKKLRKLEFMEGLPKVCDWLTNAEQPVQHRPVGWGSNSMQAAVNLVQFLMALSPKKAWKACARCQSQDDGQGTSSRLSLVNISKAKKWLLRNRKTPSVDDVQQKLSDLWKSLGVDGDSSEEEADSEEAKAGQNTITNTLLALPILNSTKKSDWRTKAAAAVNAKTESDFSSLLEISEVKQDIDEGTVEGHAYAVSDAELRNREWEDCQLELERQRQRFTNWPTLLQSSPANGCLSLLQSSRKQYFSLDQHIVHARRLRENLAHNLEDFTPDQVSTMLEELALGNLKDEVVRFVQSRKKDKGIVDKTKLQRQQSLEPERPRCRTPAQAQGAYPCRRYLRSRTSVDCSRASILKPPNTCDGNSQLRDAQPARSVTWSQGDVICQIDASQLIEYLFTGNAGLPRAGWSKEINKLCSWAKERSEAEYEQAKAREKEARQSLKRVAPKPEECYAKVDDAHPNSKTMTQSFLTSNCVHDAPVTSRCHTPIITLQH